MSEHKQKNKMESVEEWDEFYKTSAPLAAAEVLTENLHLLPKVGRALDLACGLAENAFLLAKCGLIVDAWDNSNVAINRVSQKAKQKQLSVCAKQIDILRCNISKNFYDVMVLTHFLEHSLSSSIVSALKPGGLLFCQTFSEDKSPAVGPQNPIFWLKRNELLSLFPGLKIIVYREEGFIGDLNRGFRNKAMLVAQKPV